MGRSTRASGRPAEPPPRARTMTVVAQDPAVKDAAGRVVVTQLPVRADFLEAGPRSHRFHVVDYDASTGTFVPPPSLAGGHSSREETSGWTYVDRFETTPPEELLGDFGFHAQSVYAIAARTLSSFESALGRRIPWSFGGHELYLVPHALAEANAFYSEEDRALYFGYFPDSGGDTVYTCLSHDIVAHETTHAILDGFRPRFQEPSLPDQPAFHEAFADIVALLSILAVPELVGQLLGPVDQRGRIPADRVSEAELRRSALFQLAEQMGEAVHAERGSGLRRSVALEPSPDWRSDPAFEKPHRRGEVLVAVFMQSLIGIWAERLGHLVHGGGLDRALAAEEGARIADQLLKMAIRSLDYTPPVEIEFEDFLEALVVSDAELAPDDSRGYRETLENAFAAFGVNRPSPGIVDLTQGSDQPRYHHLNFTALRTDRDEVFRFLWENAELLSVNRSFYTRVERIRPAVRVGPDGFVVAEAVADYVQILGGTAQELAALGLRVPEAVPEAAEIQVWGGGALVFDQFGAPKYHHPKPLQDWDRQSRRLSYLVNSGLRDRRGRVGFSLGTPRGQWFAEFHRPDPRAEEDW